MCLAEHHSQLTMEALEHAEEFYDHLTEHVADYASIHMSAFKSVELPLDEPSRLSKCTGL